MNLEYIKQRTDNIINELRLIESHVVNPTKGQQLHLKKLHNSIFEFKELVLMGAYDE